MNKSKKDRHTPLKNRRREGKQVKSPFSALGDKVSWSSWKDDYLPDVLWACVLTGSLDRTHYLSIFKKIAENIAAYIFPDKHASIAHSHLATLNITAFLDVMAPLIGDPDARKLVAAIQLVDSLPDAHLWREVQCGAHKEDELWDLLARGIFSCLDHQSQEATDIRWMKVWSIHTSGKLHMPADMMDKLIRYPEYNPEDEIMRSARPMVRSLEMTMRNMEGTTSQAGAPKLDASAVWEEFLRKTTCAAARAECDNLGKSQSLLVEEFEKIIVEVMEHFVSSLTNTDVDPRLDASFGLTLYALNRLCCANRLRGFTS